MALSITNPILPGFNPDPSICRVGDDYYIATSTFEWYPGVQIHHSTNLVDWELVSRPLSRPDLLDLTGVPDSCGVWAPCLSYSDGQFWLVYTIVRRFDGIFKDTHNYLTTCPEVDGDWSDRIYLNSSGFDPSLFHDADGRKYLVNMLWDHRNGRTSFGGIIGQEYCHNSRRLIGDVYSLFDGTDLDYTEGPHIYREDDAYYLLTAEGGTGYGHAITQARCQTPMGRYEVDPHGPLLSARDHPESDLQRTGHGDIVTSPTGEYYLVHLCGRPVPGTRRSPLGRETALQPLSRDADGWFRLADGSAIGKTEWNGVQAIQSAVDARYAFDGGRLPKDFQWLRTPYPERLFHLGEDGLTLTGRESMGSLFEQALVARRQTDRAFFAATHLSFSPNSFQQAAGLTTYYNGHKFYYLQVTWDPDTNSRILALLRSAGTVDLAGSIEPLTSLPASGPIELAVEVRDTVLQFFWREPEKEWIPAGASLDATLLSDEAGKGEGANFTGTFVGVACQDLTGGQLTASFRWFRYRSIQK